MKQTTIRRSLTTYCIVILAGLVGGTGSVLGYGEEVGAAGRHTDMTISTHHLHLTRALAYCAGWEGDLDLRNPLDPLLDPSVEDDKLEATDAYAAEILAFYDTLVDKGTIEADGVKWTNLTPQKEWSYEVLEGTDVGCPDATKMVFPILFNKQMLLPSLLEVISAHPKGVVDSTPKDVAEFVLDLTWQPGSGFYTHRMGPWVGQFHYPQWDDLERLEAFADGTEDTLEIPSLYGFDNTGSDWEMYDAWTGSCYSNSIKEVVNTGKMASGSAMAFATYLHSLGDYYSHRACRESYEEAATVTPPWYTHTPPGEGGQLHVKNCGFDDHYWEFGCPDKQRAEFLRGTIDGAVEVYKALIDYAGEHGLSPRIADVDHNSGWLRRQIERYATSFLSNMDEAAGACRVSFTHALMKSCEEEFAPGVWNASDPGQCVPDVEAVDGDAPDPNAPGGTCLDGGRVDYDTCDEDPDFQQELTPACEPVVPEVPEA